MRTYSERLANIKAKAKQTQKAYAAIAVGTVTLSVFALLVCSVFLWPELLFRSSPAPTLGPALQEPTNRNEYPMVTMPDIQAPTMGTLPNPTEPFFTAPMVPAPTDLNEPAPVGYMLLPMMPTDRVVDEQRIDQLLLDSGCFSNYRTIKKNCPHILSYLLNITPALLEDKCEIYRFTYEISNALAGETFLVYEGEVCQLGSAFGGYGITEFAYINDGNQDRLYFIHSSGSGIHRSHVSAFDFSTKQEMNSVAFLFQDISFFLSEDGKKLGICQAVVYGLDWDTEGVSISKGDLLHEDILKLDFVLAG